MVLDVICQLMSVMAMRNTDNSISFLLHLCASCLMYIPNEQAHNKIVRKLCEYILPMATCKCVTQQVYMRTCCDVCVHEYHYFLCEMCDA